VAPVCTLEKGVLRKELARFDGSGRPAVFCDINSFRKPLRREDLLTFS